VAAHRAVGKARAQFVTEDGKPRLERIVPVAGAVVLLGVVGFSVRRRRR
jgi:MYXO-CTERM domain-containing protein